MDFIHASGRVQCACAPQELGSVGGVPLYLAEIAFRVRRSLPAESGVQVTWHSTRSLPQGDQAQNVMIVIGEESGVLFPGLERYGLVVKTGPKRGEQFDALRSAQDLYGLFLGALRFARNQMLRLQFGARPLTSWNNLEAIPLGCSNTTYAALSSVARRPQTDRPIDISFYGDVGRCIRLPFASIAIPVTPKALARQRAIAAAERVHRKAPGVVVDVVRSNWGMGKARSLSPGEYLQRLADTKISLCPRGNFRDTFRHYEAAAMGCVVVCDRQETSWFTASAPFVVLDSWSDAERTLRTLLRDPARLTETGDATRAWWNSVVSSGAIADHLARSFRDRRNAALGAPSISQLAGLA